MVTAADRERIELSLGRLRRYKIRAWRDYLNAPVGSYVERTALRRLTDFKVKQCELLLVLFSAEKR